MEESNINEPENEEIMCEICHNFYVSSSDMLDPKCPYCMKQSEKRKREKEFIRSMFFRWN